ncbi:MAG: pseudouridine synthase, partial [Betaproteobacteria bacterium]|nr:pseudouridine synthase [Betaproteobacteria bacterium]
QKVGPGDEVRINGELVHVRFAEPRARVLMYHKPAGEIVTRDDPEGRPTVFANLPSIGSGKWINVGRLDYNTEGLLLFTNSGELANRLMHPRYEVEREYAVRILGELTPEHLQALTAGLPLEDGIAKCESVQDAGGEGSNHWYKVVLKEGRNREVRRLFEALNLTVSRLIRTRYGTLAMPSVMKRGDLLELQSQEVEGVLDAAGLKGRPAAEGHRPQPGKTQGRGPQHSGRPPGHGGPRPHGPRGGRPEAAAPQGGSRPHGQHGPRPQGQHGPRPQGQHGPQPQGQPDPRPAYGKPGGRPHGKGAQRPARGPGNGPAANANPQGPHNRRERSNYDEVQPQSNAQAPHPDARRERNNYDEVQPHSNAQPPHSGTRRERSNYDEVQPHSNANASPFGKSTLTMPGGRPRGSPPIPGAPRHRSGPRAAKGGGYGSGHGGPHTPSTSVQRHQRRPREPRAEVDGNVAPKGQERPPVDDDGQ